MAALSIAHNAALAATMPKKKKLRFQLWRHATLLIEVDGKRILVDPMLSRKEAMDPIQNAGNSNRIPMVDLPFDEDALGQWLKQLDAVMVTHTHRDHWDLAAQELIPKNTLIICQPADESKIKGQGFTRVKAIDREWTWDNIAIRRTDGQHGTGEIGKKMGPVSGFVIEHHSDRLYIAGDTIWCNDVERAIKDHQPTHVVVNGGGAKFLEGSAITMTTDDVVKLSSFSSAVISVVHLETINHCLQRRKDFREIIEKHQLQNRILVPSDGEWTSL